MPYSKAHLSNYCKEALTSVGVSAEHAAVVAAVLTSADERGVHSHGCVRMEGYVECL